MNQKFYDLRKEKQDKILGASMEIFAKYGYKNGSCDKIASNAHISKGLLFHYFETKEELYQYTYSFASMVLKYEVQNYKFDEKNDYFGRIREMIDIASKVTEVFPYGIPFLELNSNESKEFDDISKKIEFMEKMSGDLLENKVSNLIMQGIDTDNLLHMLKNISDGCIRKLIEKNIFSADTYKKEMSKYIDILEKISN